MDYGSEICLPRNPKCNICGINKFCQSYKKNLQQKIPLKLKKKTTKPIKYTRAYVIVNEKNEILVRSRPNKGMLASMLEVCANLYSEGHFKIKSLNLFLTVFTVVCWSIYSLTKTKYGSGKFRLFFFRHGNFLAFIEYH